MADYSTLPSGATLKPKPYKAHVPEEKLQLLKDLVKISPIAAPTFENTNAGRHFGMDGIGSPTSSKTSITKHRMDRHYLTILSN